MHIFVHERFMNEYSCIFEEYSRIIFMNYSWIFSWTLNGTVHQNNSSWTKNSWTFCSWMVHEQIFMHFWRIIMNNVHELFMNFLMNVKWHSSWNFLFMNISWFTYREILTKVHEHLRNISCTKFMKFSWQIHKHLRNISCTFHDIVHEYMRNILWTIQEHIINIWGTYHC